MADVPPISGDAAIGALRDELGAMVAPHGGASAGRLPTCEELLAAAPPDHASWLRVTTVLLADDAADRVLRHSGICVVCEVLDDLVDELQSREEPALSLLEFVDEQREEMTRAHAFAWLAAHRQAWTVTERRLAGSATGRASSTRCGTRRLDAARGGVPVVTRAARAPGGVRRRRTGGVGDDVPMQTIPATFEVLDDRFAGCSRRRAARAAVQRLPLGRGARLPARRRGTLVWSDIPNDRMLRWDEATGEVGVFRHRAGYTNGHTLDAEGRIVSCEHGGRRVSRTEHDGSVTTLADRFDGKRLNSPNDVVVQSDGSIWFTDPATASTATTRGTGPRARSAAATCTASIR